MKTLITLILLLINISIFSQPLTPIVDSIPTRDGKTLATDIYLPDTIGGKTYPTILIQTPYNRLFYRWNLPLVGIDIDNSPFAFVILDWRCFYGSTAACTGNYDRGKDGYDAVEWIANQSWSDSQVATWGPSALGKIQFETAKHNPPHLVCCAPLVAAPQFNYEVYFPGGSARDEYIEQLDALGYGMSAYLYANHHYSFLWAFAEADSYYPDSIQVPLLMIGGWYDHNPDMMFEIFEGLKTSSPLAVRDKHKMLIGPWAHGGNGTAYVGSTNQGQLSFPNAAGWQDSLAWQFFNYYLLGDANSYDSLSTYIYYQMGENQWYHSSDWPESGFTNLDLYLQQNKTLLTDIPVSNTDTLAYNYNPRNPSPTIGGPTLRVDLDQGPFDQAPVVESRNDILCFTSPVLSSDVRMQSYPKVILYVSSDRKDTDFAVRLTDVYPDNRSMLLVDGIQRMRFRNGYTISDTTFMKNDSIYEIEIEMNPCSHTFLAGHRIRLDISSSNYPRFNANMNDGDEMYVDGDTLIAHNIVHCNANYPSRLILNVENYPVSIKEIEYNNLDVFPNPFNESFEIVLPENWYGKKLEIEMYSLKGELVYRNSTTATKSFLVKPKQIARGSYFIRAFCNNEFRQSTILKL